MYGLSFSYFFYLIFEFQSPYLAMSGRLSFQPDLLTLQKLTKRKKKDVDASSSEGEESREITEVRAPKLVG
jgi:hypothetical protein